MNRTRIHFVCAWILPATAIVADAAQAGESNVFAPAFSQSVKLGKFALPAYLEGEAGAGLVREVLECGQRAPGRLYLSVIKQVEKLVPIHWLRK